MLRKAEACGINPIAIRHLSFSPAKPGVYYVVAIERLEIGSANFQALNGNNIIYIVKLI